MSSQANQDWSAVATESDDTSGGLFGDSSDMCLTDSDEDTTCNGSSAPKRKCDDSSQESGSDKSAPRKRYKKAKYSWQIKSSSRVAEGGSDNSRPDATSEGGNCDDMADRVNTDVCVQGDGSANDGETNPSPTNKVEDEPPENDSSSDELDDGCVSPPPPSPPHMNFLQSFVPGEDISVDDAKLAKERVEEQKRLTAKKKKKKIKQRNLERREKAEKVAEKELEKTPEATQEETSKEKPAPPKEEKKTLVQQYEEEMARRDERLIKIKAGEIEEGSDEEWTDDPVNPTHFCLSGSDFDSMSDSDEMPSDTSLSDFDQFKMSSSDNEKDKKKNTKTESQKEYNWAINTLEKRVDIDTDFCQRWQSMSTCKAVIDNSINKSLEDMNLSPHPDELYESMQRAGMSFALNDDGMMATPPSPPGDNEPWSVGHRRRLVPIVNRLTNAAEVLYVQSLRKQRRTLLLTEEQKTEMKALLWAPHHEDDILPLAAFCMSDRYFDNSTVYTPTFGRSYWQNQRRVKQESAEAYKNFKNKVERKIRRKKKQLKADRKRKRAEFEERRRERRIRKYGLEEAEKREKLANQKPHKKPKDDELAAEKEQGSDQVTNHSDAPSTSATSAKKESTDRLKDLTDEQKKERRAKLKDKHHKCTVA